MALKKRMAEVGELQTRLQRMDELMAQQTNEVVQPIRDKHEDDGVTDEDPRHDLFVAPLGSSADSGSA